MAEHRTSVTAFPARATTLDLQAALVPPLMAIPLLNPRPDRRNWTGRDALVRRLESEFKEMPGLSLTLQQAVRLFSLPQGPCQRILSALVKDGAMSLRQDGRYVRRSTSNP
jgi:hypothetical protein